MIDYMPPEVYTVVCNNCVYITNSGEVNSQDNVIYNVSVIVDYEVYNFKTLSGRSWTQELDRNKASKGAPSPNGSYTIGNLTDGYKYETGGVFLPYEPNFKTERSFLGFHIDPSWGLDNDEDGTVGCHAFESMKYFEGFYFLVKNNSIKDLIIDYNKDYTLTY